MKTDILFSNIKSSGYAVSFATEHLRKKLGALLGENSQIRLTLAREGRSLLARLNGQTPWGLIHVSAHDGDLYAAITSVINKTKDLIVREKRMIGARHRMTTSL